MALSPISTASFILFFFSFFFFGPIIHWRLKPLVTFVLLHNSVHTTSIPIDFATTSTKSLTHVSGLFIDRVLYKFNTYIFHS
ncbi:hypothetical protein C0J52_11704 [Blattella germanica]|nr:hypothetical protein C0J52_11704 [Blattella germanica]